MARPKLWMQRAFKPSKRGLLHRQLGIPQDQKIPLSLLRKIKNARIGSYVKMRGRRKKVTRLLKRRAVAAYNARMVRR